jgi:NADPH2:quinone reductase
MKSYWAKITGGKIAVELRDIPKPDPGPGQVLVRVRAAGLNRGEFIIGHSLQAEGSAKAAGMEAAGEVVACGAGVTALTPGDAVMGRCGGGFAEYVLLDAREAMAKPAKLSWEQAAAVPLSGLVVHDMLVLQGHLQAGQWLLIPGVSSGLGVTALTMAKALGAKVIGTSGSQAKLDHLKTLGLDLGICTRAPDFHDAVMQATGGKGVNLVVNAVGGTMFAESVRCLAFQGRLAVVGYVDGSLHAEIDLDALHAKRLTLFGVSNKLRNADMKAQGVPPFKAQILPMLADGRIVPLVDRVLPFEQLAEAKAAMEAAQHMGKIVLAGLP